MTSKYYSTFKLVAGLLISLYPSCLLAQEQGQDRRYSMGIGAPGSVSYNIGVGFSSVVKLIAMPEGGPDLGTVSTDGYHDSLQRIIDGTAQFAIVDSVSAQKARDGTESFQGKGLGDQLKVVAALWRDVDHFFLANEYAQSGTIGDLAVLSGQDIATDSASHWVARDIMARFGASIDFDDEPTWSEWNTPLEAFDRDEVAGFVVTGVASSSEVLDLMQRLDGRAQLLEFSRRQLANIDAGWHAHVLTPDAYPGLATQIDTAARTVMLVAHESVPEDDVYQLTKVIFDNLPYLTNMDEVAGHISLDHAQQEINLPVHPGAARYYQDVAASPASSNSQVAELQNGHENHASQENQAGHENHAGHGAAHEKAEQHNGHNGAAPEEHIHDEAMLSRARAEIHDNEEVLKIGRPLVLRHPETEIFNVYFGLGKVDLLDKDLAKVNMITEKIMAFHKSKGREPEVYVEGYTDSTGDWKLNYEIAHKRARGVMDLLINEGVPKSWIHISDYSEQGLAVPTADGVAEERNRRVEITIIPQG